MDFTVILFLDVLGIKEMKQTFKVCELPLFWLILFNNRYYIILSFIAVSLDFLLEKKRKTKTKQKFDFIQCKEICSS